MRFITGVSVDRARLDLLPFGGWGDEKEHKPGRRGPLCQVGCGLGQSRWVTAPRSLHSAKGISERAEAESPSERSGESGRKRSDTGNADILSRNFLDQRNGTLLGKSREAFVGSLVVVFRQGDDGVSACWHTDGKRGGNGAGRGGVWTPVEGLGGQGHRVSLSPQQEPGPIKAWRAQK